MPSCPDPQQGRASTYRPNHPLDLPATVRALSTGPGDPCWRTGPDGTIWWATGTPLGPGLLSLHAMGAQGPVLTQAWGQGADWLLEGVPELLGADDDPAQFRPEPRHRVLVRAWRARPGLRVPRSRRVLDALALACIAQRVTGVEAVRGWRALVRRFGQPAPGAPAAAGGPAHGLWVPPTAAAWRSVPSWDWLAAGVDEQRRAPLIAAAGAPHGLERTLELAPTAVDRALQSLPRVGRWTSAEVRQRAHGDADAMSFGDYHVARDVSWALTGQVLDDDGCAQVVACYAGHRYRVQRLLELAGVSRPRHGPRMTLPTHTPARFLAPRPGGTR